MRLSDLESLYQNFPSIYQTHIQKARFDNVLQRNSYFMSRKLRLISIRSILEKYRPLHPEMRNDLIRSVLFEGNFGRAQQILTKVEDKKLSNAGTRGIGSRFHGSGSSEDTLKREMKNLANSVSDSQFLLDIKNIGDKEIRTVIEQVDDLVYEQLGSSIDKMEKAMIPVVLDMQRQRCGRSMQHEVESQEKNLLRGALTELVRDVNALSVGRGDS
jgi:hypothetical protein